MKLFMLFLLWVITFPTIVKGKGNSKNARIDRIWRARKQNCEESEECRDMLPEESMNCVNLVSYEFV